MTMRIIDIFDEISHPSASIEDSMLSIRDLMRESRLNYLPLLDDNGKVFGIVDSQVIADSHESDTPNAAQNAWELCDRDFKFVDINATTAEAVSIMHQMDVSFMVVQQKGRYVGAITSHLLLDKLSAQTDTSAEATAVEPS